MIRFFMKSILVLTLIATLCLLYGFFIEPKRLLVKHHQLLVEHSLDKPLKIGVISDVHIGGYHMSPERVVVIVSKLNELELDIVLITGDFISGHTPREEMDDHFNDAVEQGLKAFEQLNAKLGTVAVIGNHDVWYDAAYVAETLEQVGVTVLSNDVTHVGTNICVVGLADNLTQEEDPKSFAKCRPNDFIVALMHSPDSFLFLRSDVQFAAAGHTHAGQINIPMLGRFSDIIELGREYKYGLESYNGVPVYISAGLGTSMLPARFRAPPEITVLTLQPRDHLP